MAEIDRPEPSAVARSLVRTALALALLAGVYSVLPLQGDRWWLGAVIGGVAAVLSVPLFVYRVRRVRWARYPFVDAVEALILVASLVVVAFSAVYFALASGEDQLSGLGTRVDAVYFTMSTFSTVGFGDITATGQAARLIVTLQIAVDLALIGVGARVLTSAARLRSAELPHPDRPTDQS